MTLLEEETRHSLMIEGNIVSKQELRKIIGEGVASRHSAQEVLAYFEAAVSAYELAFQQYKENDFQLTKPFVRQVHALMFRGVDHFAYEPGAWRNGPIKIAQARVEAPPHHKVEKLIESLVKTANQSAANPIRKAAVFHSIFEQIHPFPDGNGRVGRILLNYILIAHGLPNIAIKGLETEKNEYFSALESSDAYVSEVLRGVKRWTRAQNKPFVGLENLICKNLAISLDTVICTRFVDSGSVLQPLDEVAKHIKMSYQSLRTACSQKKVISMKIGGRLLTHPVLLKKPTT
ncbi:MAG: hypothetical protein UX60_C0025G0008 [Berkelbacteria bacterium GW2011_GWA2_46_7]|uniref:Fido domain-containing protein n=1 Tax=Berkelbacteria bacterium GW2011_GWA2_46_7 TaxID=1618335 RepID=A0A0G1SN23_9BACT|nr:MAG: hypothetical protein UX60_C0025G0008 [Berkelbacteria bacterium GW2011_GWA2_46_7]